MKFRAMHKYAPTSARKARIVIDLIRSKPASEALEILQFCNNRAAVMIDKVLRSAIANAQQKPGFSGDVERLFVSVCYADQGPSQKRVRPAPMGRAFRVVKRTAHLTVAVAERPEKKAGPAPAPKPGKAATGAGAAPAAKPRAQKSTKTGGEAAAQKK